MSFACVGCFKGHLIGIADRKSTNCIAGVSVTDPDRPSLTKLWHNDSCVIALTGANCFFTDDPEDPDGERKIFLEDLMSRRIRRFRDPETLINRLYEYVRRNAKSEPDPIVATAYYFDGPDLYSIESVFDSFRYSMNRTLHRGWCFTTAGSEDYQRYFRKMESDIVSLNADKMKENLDLLIREYESEHPGEYDPVGMGWDICII